MLSYGAKIEETDKFKDEILLGLASNGDEEDIINIVKQGANVNYSSKLGMTPLHYLCSRKDISTVSAIKF